MSNSFGEKIMARLFPKLPATTQILTLGELLRRGRP